MINYVTFLDFITVLIFVIFSIIPKVLSYYPVINMLAFITSQKYAQFSGQNFSHFNLYQSVPGQEMFYTVSNGTDLVQLRRNNLKYLNSYSLKKPCSQIICDRARIETVHLSLDKNVMWFCFSYASSTEYAVDDYPYCYMMEANSLTDRPLGQWRALKYISNDFEHRSVQLVSTSNLVYSGFFLKKVKQLVVSKNSILFHDVSKVEISTPNLFFQAPGDFISSFQHNQSVYFLYLETSFVCGFKNVRLVTRLLQLCEKDNGNSDEEFSYFSKVDVQCQQRSDKKLFPSYTYRVATAAVWLNHTNQLVVTFVSDNKDAPSSAICVYAIKDIIKAFNSDFKKQSEIPSYQENKFMDVCQEFGNNGNMNNLSPLFKSYPFHKIIVKDDAVFQIPETKFLKISADESIWSSSRRIMLFLSTQSNNQHGLLQISLMPHFCVLRKFLSDESITMLESTNEEDKRFLYIGTSQRLIKMPMDTCRSYISGDQCKLAANPYCYWSSNLKNCEYIFTEEQFNLISNSTNYCGIKSKNQSQTTSESWGSCALISVTDDSKQIGTCRCGKTISSESNEKKLVVSEECKVDGEWTIFSQWSGCSATCGKSLQVRTRSCENPKPRSGGKDCPGNVLETRECLPEKLCSNISSDQFSNLVPLWNNWSSCSRSCGEGIQTRSQKCLNTNCAKLPDQTRLCENKPCENVVKSEWSEWSKINVFTSTKTRLRFQCLFRYVNEPAKLFINYVISHNQYPQCVSSDCPTKYKGQIIKGNLKQWSKWSSCNKECDSLDWTVKSRNCSERKCFGSRVDLVPCNSEPCRSIWTCWSQWEGCSQACETAAERSRFRQCVFDKNMNPCEGQSNEISDCPLIQCKNSYSKWSQWSTCTSQDMSTRNRKCLKNSCLFTLIQSKPCQQAVKEKPMLYSVMYMIVSALVGFLIGILLAAIICYVWWKCTIHAISSTYGGSNRPSNSALQLDNAYDSQSLQIIPDNYGSMFRHRTPSNSESFFKNPSPPFFEPMTQSYHGRQQPLLEEPHDLI